MDKIDLLVMRYRDFLASADAFRFVSDGINTSHFDAVSDRNRIHVGLEFLTELAAETGAEIEKKPRGHGQLSTEFFIRYDGLTIYALGNSYGTS